MKAKDMHLFSPIKVGNAIWVVMAIEKNKALIKSQSGKTKWITINRIK